MSWKATGVEHLRAEFVLLASEADVSKSAACREFGISRKTGYKWLRRYAAQGLTGLGDRSRRPRTSPLQVSGSVVVELVRLRHAHPHWGPKKLRALLVRGGFQSNGLPSVATLGRILRRVGLSESKGRGRPRRWMPDRPVQPAGGPNEVWTVDFKGWWRTRNRERCEPLGIRDLFSRYILCLRPMRRRRVEDVRAVFAEVFERYGLPEVIRSDNGVPFASLTGPHGLTRLSAWWKTLGIRLDRTAPGHPEQNGSHERMHQDLAQEIEGKPAVTLYQEAKRLERWRVEYNVRRPHEALGMKTPGEVYRCSRRRLKDAEPYCYPTGYLLRRVGGDGCVLLNGTYFRVSDALAKTEVGLQRLDGTRWRVWFCDLAVKELEMERALPRWLAAPAVTQVLPMSR
jgi:transposase InsO family protein